MGLSARSPADASPLVQQPDHLLLRVKAVPGASREALAGVLGDRLKVRVAEPPEGGRANAAICALVARTLGLRPRQVAVQAGHASAEKTLRIDGWPGHPDEARTLLGLG